MSRRRGRADIERSRLEVCFLDPSRTLGRSVRGRLFALSPPPLGRKVLGFAHCARRSSHGVNMQRRGFITLFAGVVMGWPLGVRGQQAARIYRVASAWVATEPTVRPLEQAFLAVLAERGYVVGRNLLYESRYANGEATRPLALVAELLAFRP